MRKAVRDVEVKGQGDVVIPKGWCVLVYFRSVHLDANIYDDPYAFNPWRWKERDMAAATANSGSGFTPFGGGQRLCPGLDLARLQTSIFLHHLVTNFTYVNYTYLSTYAFSLQFDHVNTLFWIDFFYYTEDTPHACASTHTNTYSKIETKKFLASLYSSWKSKCVYIIFVNTIMVKVMHPLLQHHTASNSPPFWTLT